MFYVITNSCRREYTAGILPFCDLDDWEFSFVIGNGAFYYY